MITDSEIKEFIPSSITKQYKTEPVDQNVSDLSFSFTHSYKSSIKPKLNDSIQFDTQLPLGIGIKPPLTSKGDKKIQIPIIRDKLFMNNELDYMSTPRQRLQDYKYQLINLKKQNQQKQKITQQVVVDKLQKQLKESQTPNFSKSKEIVQIELLLSAYNQLHMSHSLLKQQHKVLQQEKDMWKLKYYELEKQIKQNTHLKTSSLQMQIKRNSFDKLKTQFLTTNKIQIQDKQQTK